jgi:hypothetical protein
MGGFGSGSHHTRPDRKTTVEECRCLDVTRWVRQGILKAGVHQKGVCQWVGQDGPLFSIDLEVMTTDMGRPVVVLSDAHPLGGEQRQGSYQVRLTTTVPRFGGIRWWFVCPQVRWDRPCGRRVGKLYLPPGGRYFGCRHCYDLSYTSSQESRKHDSVFRHLAAELGGDPREIKRLLYSVPPSEDQVRETQRPRCHCR